MLQDYLEVVVDGKPAAYSGLLIRGCSEYTCEDGHCYVEEDNTNPQFFGVYIQPLDEGSICVADAATYEAAYQYAAKKASLYGWTVSSCYKPH